MSDQKKESNPKREIEEKEMSDLRLNVPKIMKQEVILKDVNFINHIGAFCHNDSASPSISEPRCFTDTISLDGQPFKLEYTVTPDPRFGYPGSIAYRLWDWIEATLSFYGRPAKNPIVFDMPALRVVTGLAKSGQNDKLIKKAIDQLRFTDISTKCYRLGKNKWVKTDLKLIQTVVEVGIKGQMVGGLIYLNDNVLESFNNALSMPLNNRRYLNLNSTTTAAKALYVRLFRAFSAAKQSNPSAVPIFVKDYETLCRGINLTPMKYKSRIKQQLTGPFNLLAGKKVKLIESFEILKNSNGNGFNIKVTAAEGFDEDFRKFQHVLPFLPAQNSSNPKTEDILASEAVIYFLEKRFGLDRNEGFINPKDINNMQSFIGLLPENTTPMEFIDFCLRKAEEQNMEIKQVGGLKIFVNSFLGSKAKKEKDQQKRKKEESNQENEELINDFLSMLWARFAQENPEQSNIITEQFHDELMGLKIIKDYFDSHGEEGILYKTNLIQLQRKFAQSCLVHEAFDEWNQYLADKGKEDLDGLYSKLSEITL